MEDDSIDRESVSISSSKRKAVEMLRAEDGDGDVHIRTTNKGSKPEGETGAGIECDSGEGGGGVIKNLISTLFRPGDKGWGNERVDGENEAESGSGERVNDESASEEGSSNGPGGIIRKIMSHLPPALPEDAAPTTDEASILIHCIIHD